MRDHEHHKEENNFDADDVAPGIVWALFHTALYLWWAAEYLTTLTVSVDKTTGLTIRRRLSVRARHDSITLTVASDLSTIFSRDALSRYLHHVSQSQ